MLLLLRPMTVVALAALLIASPHLNLSGIRIPLILLGLFAATMALQLVPLPPALWLSLPGHARYAEAAAAAGMAQPWRPLSLTPDLTLNSLLALLPILTMLIGFASIGRHRDSLILFPLILAGISVVLGIIQITGGPSSLAYFYRPTSDLLPVGVFANRNHQAAVLATVLPVLAVWARHPQAGRYRLAMAGGGMLLLVPVILVTGSRAGMGLAGLGLASALLLIWPVGKAWRFRPIVYAAGLVLLLAAVGVTILAGRAVSIDRLSEAEGATTELRLVTLPIVLQIVRDHLPLGAGYGAFDQVFRGYEPDFLLRPTFFNRAHDDILETILSGGVPALLVEMSFAVWWFYRTVRAWRGNVRNSYQALLAKLGAIVTGMLVLASLVDYPLRTPLAGVLFALACCWLAGPIQGIGVDSDDDRAARSIAFPSRRR